MRRAVLPWVWLVLLACCAMATGQAADAASVRLAGVDYLGDLPTVIAHDEGLFARHGLDVEVEFNGSGRDNLERLRAGTTDFALMALTPIVLDRLADPSPGQADDPVILASLVHSTRLNHVVVPASGPVEHPADLRGRRVGLRKGTNSEFAIKGTHPRAAPGEPWYSPLIVHRPGRWISAPFPCGRSAPRPIGCHEGRHDPG